jgi:hypothetical protein
MCPAAAGDRSLASVAEEVGAMTVHEEAGKPALREEAIAQLKKRREFGVHLLVYFLVNGFVVLI